MPLNEATLTWKSQANELKKKNIPPLYSCQYETVYIQLKIILHFSI